MSRELILVGSVPLESAMKVFKSASDAGLLPFLPRIPDGEQQGWVLTLHQLWNGHPALEQSGEMLPITRRPTASPVAFATPRPSFHLKAGHQAMELMINDMGVASGFVTSYEQFKRAKVEGILPERTRFVATLAGPATVASKLDIPYSELFPVLSRMYRGEIGRMLNLGEPAELTIQLDLAWELGFEEYRRRPQAWDSPHATKKEHLWPFEETVSLIGEIAGIVPEPVELGFHLCAFYHADESQGQDLNVFVDWANALKRNVMRAIDYIHMPTVPDYDVSDFEPLRRLRLDQNTKLYLGVIHTEDGFEGAMRRITAAEEVRSDFGIGSFCGLKVPSMAQVQKPMSIDKVLDLHRALAQSA